MNPLQPPVGFRLHWFAQGAVKTCRVCCHCQAFWHAEIAALKLTTSGLTWNLAVISQRILNGAYVCCWSNSEVSKIMGDPKVTMGFSSTTKNGPILDDIPGWLWTAPFAWNIGDWKETVNFRKVPTKIYSRTLWANILDTFASVQKASRSYPRNGLHKLGLRDPNELATHK